MRKTFLELLILAVCVWGLTNAFPRALIADDAPKRKPAAAPSGAEQAKSKVSDPYAVPDGSPTELLEFIEELHEMRPDVATRAEAVRHYGKMSHATIEAAERILEARTDVETAVAAVRAKFLGLSILQQIGDRAAGPRLQGFADALAKDKRPEVVDAAHEQFLVARAHSLHFLERDGQARLVHDLIEWLRKGPIDGPRLSLAVTIGQGLERLGAYGLAGQTFEKTAELMAASKNPRLLELAPKIEGYGRHARLMGNPIKITGTTVDGKPFDWSKYRGKVVLVDFWATWCGPCLQELPNVRRHYEKYHDRGFEIVGVSLDSDRARLEAFLKQQEIPWTNLFWDKPEEQGWDNPLANYYGIDGIPAVVLVDQEGKVVSLDAYGARLGEWLEKLLPGKPSP